ncbi:MAG: hypothetical protein IJX89_03645 [Alphaproteobacteria bacterium]|nr:hypothetical protein [Alphaproteobacteria bacterium]
MTEKLLTPNQLAENLGIKPFTLLQYRMNGKGPKYIKLGHLVRNRTRPQ